MKITSSLLCLTATWVLAAECDVTRPPSQHSSPPVNVAAETHGTADNASKAVTVMRKVLPLAQKQRKYSIVAWSRIVKSITTYKIDFRPRGKVPVPDHAGHTVKIRKFIIGGKDAYTGQFPWFVSITVDGSFICGGSLVALDWVLTASHCLHGMKTFSVLLGSLRRTSPDSRSVTMTTTVKYLHPSFNPDTLFSDVGLLKLPRKVTTSKNINIVRLPKETEASKSFEATTANICGHGLNNDLHAGGAPTNSLQYITMKVISNVEAYKAFGSYVVNSTLCCTKTGTASSSTCQGDSGGPLVYQESANVSTQIGVVSFGASGNCAEAPSCFARVSSFLGWISTTSDRAIRR